MKSGKIRAERKGNFPAAPKYDFVPNSEHEKSIYERKKGSIQKYP